MPSYHPFLPKALLEKLKTDPVLGFKGSAIYEPDFEQFRLDSSTGPCKDRMALEIGVVGEKLNPIFELTPEMQSCLPHQLRTLMFTMGRFSTGDKTWLHFAAFYSDVPVAYEIIRMGININQTDKGGATSLLVALAKIFVLQTTCLPFAKKFNPGSFSFSRIQNASQAMVNSLNPDYIEKCLARHVHIATLLIEQHADVNTGAYGFTPLSLAVEACRWDLVELLLRHGARRQPIQDFKYASSADKARFESLLSQISPSYQRPPQKCPCWSGKLLSECHDNGRSKPRPEHFLCGCGKRKAYGNCCKKNGIRISEQWDDQERWIAPSEEGTVHWSPLDMDRSNMDPAVKPLIDLAVQTNLYELGIKRLVCLYPQAPGEPFHCPARVLRPLAKGIGLEDQFDPGWWYAYEQTEFTPQPWVGVISRLEGQRRMVQWNELVDRYISVQDDPQRSFDIERNLKIGPDGGPLYKRCENEGCDYVESRNGEKMKHCSQCKMIFYCSERCQKIGWKKGHKDNCKNGKHSRQLLNSQRAMKQIMDVFPALVGLATARGDDHLPFGIAL